MSSLRAKRESIVLEHMAAEARGDFGAALATFREPRYEVMATGETHEGADAVRAFYAESARAFPDLRFEETVLQHADEAVFVETSFRATHLGEWRGLPATGRTVAYPMLNVFVFRDADLVAERMFFDLLTPLRQLGIARDPTSWSGRLTIAANHPLVVGRALLRSLRSDAVRSR